MSRRQRVRPQPATDTARFSGSLEPVALGTSIALWTLGTLVPSEGAVHGSGASLAVAWMLLLVLVHLLAVQRRSLQLNAVDLLVLALSTWLALSSLMMAWQGNPRQTWNATWQWAALLASYWTCRQVFTSEVRARWLAAVFVSLAVGLAAHGAFQFFVTIPGNLREYEQSSEAEKRQVLIENGIDPEPHSPLRQHFENRLRSTEPFATFGLANSLAGVLATWLLVLIAWRLRLPRSSAWMRAAIGCAALLVLACLVLTKSRSAWIAFALGCLALIALHWRVLVQMKFWLIPSALAVAAAAVAGGIAIGALDREVLTQAKLSVQYRLQYWYAALQITAEQPLFGCGPGNFQEYYSQYKLPMASETVADPHNFVLELAATAGVPAASILIVILLLVALYVLRGRRAGSEMSMGTQQFVIDDELPKIAYFSLLLGGVISIAYRWLVDLPVESDPWLNLPVVLLIDLPASILTLWLLQRSGAITLFNTAVPLALAICVLVINLLAAGGISYLGVGQSLWVMLALVANQATPSIRRARAPIVGLAASLLLLAACWLNGYSPVLKSQALLEQVHYSMQQRELSASLNDARQLAWHATRADALSPEPWQVLAQIDLQRWLMGQEDAAEHFGADVAEARRRNRRSYVQESMIGRQYLQAYRMLAAPHALTESLAAYRRAAKLAPNNNFIHIQCAWVAHLANEPELAGRHARLALELDAQNPHWEQQLKQLRVIDFGDEPGKADEPHPDSATAEQVAVWLRKRYYLEGGN